MLSTIRERWPDWMRALAWKRRELLERWRGLPVGARRAIIAGLMVLALVGPITAWRVFFSSRPAPAGPPGRVVVLYTSVDEPVLRPIAAAFTSRTGIDVKIVGDTEATKTTGLVERLLAERDRPRADVFWSSESAGVLALSKAGVLEPFVVRAEADFGKGGWPAHLRASDGTWYGFAQRARVIAFNTNRVTPGEAPRRLRDLALPRWRNKIGMARPQFGTTRSHMAATLAANSPETFRAWLDAMRLNGVRMYDGNSAVVRGLAFGEIEVGLTDTDDVWTARQNDWAVDLVYEQPDAKGEPGDPKQLRSVGVLTLSNTVARIRGSPHPREAGELTEFLLSAEAERMLAEGESHNVPIRPALAKEFARYAVPTPAPIDPSKLDAAIPEAMRACVEVLGLQ